jgi:hypothetical protein
MKAYMTMRNSDEVEGRGPMVNDACFMFKKDAEDYINNMPGVMGRRAIWSSIEPYGDWLIKEVEIYESLEVFRVARADTLRNNALAKLTVEERKILNLE